MFSVGSCCIFFDHYGNSPDLRTPDYIHLHLLKPGKYMARAHNEEERVTSGARVLGGTESLCLNLE